MWRAERAAEGPSAEESAPAIARAAGPSALPFAVAISAIAAAVATLAYYPGVLYSDSYERWRVAIELLEGRETTSYLSVGPSLWMAATYAVTQNFAAYTLLQAFLFFLSTLLVVARLGRVRGAWILVPAAALVLFPLFPGYAVYHEGSVGCVVGMNFLFLAATWEPVRSGRLAAALRGAALLAALFTIFSFRQNAVTLLPAIALLLWKRGRSRVARVTDLALAGVALGAVLLTPALLGIRGGSSGIGFAWEIVGTLKRVQDPVYERYLDYAGNTRAALAADVENGIWNGLVSPQVLPFARLTDPTISSRLKRDYVRLASLEPGAFLANKLAMARRTLGIGQPLFFFEFDENRYGFMPQFGYRDTEVRHRQFERVGAVMEWPFLRTPWLVLLVGLALFGVARRAFAEPPPLAGTLLLFAAFYYGAFLVTTQAYEFRYFYPALHLVMVLALVVGVVALAAAARWAGARARPFLARANGIEAGRS